MTEARLVTIGITVYYHHMPGISHLGNLIFQLLFTKFRSVYIRHSSGNTFNEAGIRKHTYKYICTCSDYYCCGYLANDENNCIIATVSVIVDGELTLH